MKTNKSLFPKLAFSSLAKGSTAIILSSVIGNISNFIYNAYLGRAVSVEEFGTISLISSVFGLTTLLTDALGRTVAYKTARAFGKVAKPVKTFWNLYISRVIFISAITTIVWLFAAPLTARFFNINSIVPLLLFTPAWTFILPAVVNKGTLSGNLKFISIALIVITESLAKLALAIGFVEIGHSEFVYLSIPLSTFLSVALSYFVIRQLKSEVTLTDHELRFPKKFFGSSVLTNLAALSFLSFDVILAKHYLPEIAAGEYALLSLTGKIIFFLGGLFIQFIVPLTSHAEGANKDTGPTFYKLLCGALAASLFGYLVVGIFGSVTVPILFGEKALAIISFLPQYGLAMVAYTVTTCFISFHQIKGHHLFPITGLTYAIVQVLLIMLGPKTAQGIVTTIYYLSAAQLAVVVLLHLLYGVFDTLWENFTDFLGIFKGSNDLNHAKESGISDKLRILIFNWRDTKHVWGGGAEVYVHEMAKRWVVEGHSVTLFCGNDRKNNKFETVDGVHVVRRGGFYTVYLWAALYYIFRFRGKYDCIVDCENGIPFFTPLYSKVPTVLLIHHVHQEVFRKHLPFPLSYIAMFMESRVMPFVYKNSKIVTISESSRKAIASMNWAEESDVNIVNPGINNGNYKKYEKTAHPSFLYIGRLQPWKNVDVAIHAFAKILENHTDAKLTIAGFGESIDHLKKLSKKYGLNGAVNFTGFVSEERKQQLLAEAWVSLQPSSFEGWGITVIEANAAGTPVIASNISGLIDSVKDTKTGILVPVRDIENWAKAMDGMIRYEGFRSELSQNALKWSKNFSWDKSAKLFLDNIIKTIDSKHDVITIKRIELKESKHLLNNL